MVWNKALYGFVINISLLLIISGHYGKRRSLPIESACVNVCFFPIQISVQGNCKKEHTIYTERRDVLEVKHDVL